MESRAGLNFMEKRKCLTLYGFKFQPLGRADSLYRVHSPNKPGHRSKFQIMIRMLVHKYQIAICMSETKYQIAPKYGYTEMKMTSFQ